MLPDAQHRVWFKTKEAMQRNGNSPTASAWRMKRLLFCPPIFMNGAESKIWNKSRAYSAWMVSTMDRRRMRRDGPRTAKAADNATNSTISTSDAQGTYQGVPQLAVTVCS